MVASTVDSRSAGGTKTTPTSVRAASMEPRTGSRSADVKSLTPRRPTSRRPKRSSTTRLRCRTRSPWTTSKPRCEPSVSCQTSSTPPTPGYAPTSTDPLGITPAYQREDGAEHIKVQGPFKGVDLERVGGGTSTPPTRSPLPGEFWAEAE